MRFSSVNTEHADENGRNYVVNIGGRLGWREQTEEREREKERSQSHFKGTGV